MAYQDLGRLGGKLFQLSVIHKQEELLIMREPRFALQQEEEGIAQSKLFEGDKKVLREYVYNYFMRFLT